jgi:hypothetical protein
MRGSASAIIRRGVFILLLLSAVRSMSGTIKCLFKEGALENLGECSTLSTRSLTLIGIPQTHPVVWLGETLRVTEETGKVHLHLLEYWDDRPPLRQRTNSGITNLLHELVRALILPRGPRDPKRRRRQESLRGNP